ncbi:hypothetical protein A4A49_36229 [Nicotiana attenuata]|uniref:Uncharacterized protein n=1 Tax=Nicotiana attenuata TaxID=49451 RepID=A0A314L4C6_NICAT|nr:hypothetical protein A4A49_36229 [Nicotiana attenuata]
MHEKLIDVIGKPAKIIPPENDVQGNKVYLKHLEEYLATKRIILASMSSELQRKHQNMDPAAIIEYLKNMVDTQLDIENSPVGSLVNHMIVLTEEREELGYNLGKELSEDLILQSVHWVYQRNNGYYFYHPSDKGVFVARGATLLEREFLLEGNYSGEIELDEVQETDESTQNKDHETQVEEPLLDVLKLTKKLSSSAVEVQELNVVQEQVNKPVPIQIDQQPNPTQGAQAVQDPLRRSTQECRVPTRLNLIV